MKSQNREVKEESMGGEGRTGGLTDLNVVHRDLSDWPVLLLSMTK